LVTWGGTTAAVDNAEERDLRRLISICESTLLSAAEKSNALEPSVLVLVGVAAVDTLGGGVREGELSTLEEMRWSLALPETIVEESVVARRAVPLCE
jgi:hypothetical protein